MREWGRRGTAILVYGVSVDDWLNAGLCSGLIQVIVILIIWGAGPILRNWSGI